MGCSIIEKGFVMKERGIGIALKRNKRSFFVEITMLGKLTHEDYQLFTPMVDKVLEETKTIKADLLGFVPIVDKVVDKVLEETKVSDINLLVDMRDFEGWEFMAAWDNLKFGVEHRNDFEKMAILGDKNWEKAATSMMNHLIQGEAEFFNEREKALSWLLNQ
jgi:hypothetical protein